MGIECVYVWGVLMWKNLYLFFCFLESANNVREPNNSPARDKKREKLGEPFRDQKNIQNQKCFFPPFLTIFEPHFPFSLGASSLKIFKIIATYY